MVRPDIKGWRGCILIFGLYEGDRMILERSKRLEEFTIFAQRAVQIACRDGIPDKGSDEIRIHSALREGPHIETRHPMVSFRIPGGRPCAFLEVLFSDDERTRIASRGAIVLNPETGKIDDTSPFYWDQAIPGDIEHCLRYLDDRVQGLKRYAGRQTGHKDNGVMVAHVKAWARAEAKRHTAIKDLFMRAAKTMNLDIYYGNNEQKPSPKSLSDEPSP